MYSKYSAKKHTTCDITSLQYMFLYVKSGLTIVFKCFQIISILPYSPTKFLVPTNLSGPSAKVE